MIFPDLYINKSISSRPNKYQASPSISRSGSGAWYYSTSRSGNLRSTQSISDPTKNGFGIGILPRFKSRSSHAVGMTEEDWLISGVLSE